MGAISIVMGKRRKRTALLRPQEKVAHMILPALGPSAVIRSTTIPGDERPGPTDCLIIEGMVRGKAHRVMVAGARGASSTSAESFHRVAGHQESLAADAAFICVRGGLSGESLLQCARLGLVPVEIRSNGNGLKVHLGPATVVRHASIQSWVLCAYDASDPGKGKSFDGDSGELLFREKAVRNWLCRESARLLRKVEKDCLLSARYRFKRMLTLHSWKAAFPADAFEIRFACRIRNRVHSLRADLTAVRYQPGLRKAVPMAKVSVSGTGAGDGASLNASESPLAESFVPDKVHLLVYHSVAAAPRPGLPDLSRRIHSTAVAIQYS